MGDHFKTDIGQLQQFLTNLEKCVDELNEARSALDHVRADQIGTPRLDEACDKFQDGSCRKTLAQYSFDTFCPQITKVDGAEATKGRPKNMTLTLHTADGQESPLMRINPVPRRGPWRNPWPEGIENGLYIAGDLPFGAVGYVPSSGVFLLMQPEDWDATAHDRKQADHGRTARAQDADLTRRII